MEKTSNVTKATISLDKDQMQLFKAFAKSRGMTFSGFVSFSCSTVMGQLKSYDIINDIAAIMSKVKEGGKLSDDDKKLLDAFEAMRSFTDAKV